MGFFTNFPAVIYRGKAAPNISLRFKIPEEFLSIRELYHPYTIIDGDRPDTIAYYYYDNAEYDWVIYLANNIQDIRSDWPLTADQFNKYIIDTYGSIANAYVTKYYNLVEQSNITSVTYNALPNNLRKYWMYNSITDTYSITDKDLMLSISSYNNLDPTEQSYWKVVRYIDCDIKTNESKRNIKLIDKQYVSQLEESLKRLLNEAV